MAAGELSSAQRLIVDRAIRAAEESSRVEFSVFVGSAGTDPRATAQGLHAALVLPDRSVLVLVDPGQRALEVVTGRVVRRSLPDEQVHHAVVTMQTAFHTGDVVGGLVAGIGQLAQQARAGRALQR